MKRFFIFERSVVSSVGSVGAVVAASTSAPPRVCVDTPPTPSPAATRPCGPRQTHGGVACLGVGVGGTERLLKGAPLVVVMLS